jgi:hypothetical protein
MEKNDSSSKWDGFLNFMDSSAAFFTFLAAVGGPIATAIAWRSIIKCNTEAQLQLIQAQDASWLMRQQYLNQQADGTQN